MLFRDIWKDGSKSSKTAKLCIYVPCYALPGVLLLQSGVVCCYPGVQISFFACLGAMWQDSDERLHSRLSRIKQEKSCSSKLLIVGWVEFTYRHNMMHIRLGKLNRMYSMSCPDINLIQRNNEFNLQFCPCPHMFLPPRLCVKVPSHHKLS